MGQQDVLDFLNKYKGKKLTSKEIGIGLNYSAGSITSSCKKLRNAGFINAEKAFNGKYNHYLYWVDKND